MTGGEGMDEQVERALPTNQGEGTELATSAEPHTRVSSDPLYVRWATMWHQVVTNYTWCGRIIPERVAQYRTYRPLSWTMCKTCRGRKR